MNSEAVPAIRIRRAKPDDAAGIAHVHVDSWRTTYAGILPDEVIALRSYDKRELGWRGILSDPDEKEFVFVAETHEERIVGFACGGRERSGDPVYDAEVSAIYVLESYQRREIGRKLMTAAADELLRRGFRAMLIWVLADNPSRKFYQALV